MESFVIPIPDNLINTLKSCDYQVCDFKHRKSKPQSKRASHVNQKVRELICQPFSSLQYHLIEIQCDNATVECLALFNSS